MKKKIKDLTRTEMESICDAFNYKCEICPLYNKRNRACARAYFDTITSKFDYEEMSKEVFAKLINKIV